MELCPFGMPVMGSAEHRFGERDEKLNDKGTEVKLMILILNYIITITNSINFMNDIMQ